MRRAGRQLEELEQLRASFGRGLASRKLALLEVLDEQRSLRAAEVSRLHECLCFLRAYPDDAEVLERVERMLGGFAARPDLRTHREALADSGIAGTPIYFRFYWPMARWLCDRWPDRLFVDWPEFRGQARLQDVLYVLVPYCELAAVENLDVHLRGMLGTLKGPDETDAAFVVRRVAALPYGTVGREAFYDGLDLPLRLDPGPDTPARTLARLAGAGVTFQERPLAKIRPSLRRVVARRPRSVKNLPANRGRALIDLAREAMCTRSRDLDAFSWGDERDVQMVDWGDGLQFAVIGVVPERRLLLEAVYAFLTLKNGVPIGYVLVSSLFRSSEIAFNVFDTYRGVEAAAVFCRALATARVLFGARAFSIDSYQLGYDNTEGLRSGAWWFYYKLGFRPDDPGVRRVLRGELARMKKNPRHRSDLATLQKLAAEKVYLSLDRSKRDILGKLSPAHLSLRMSELLAERFGSAREAGLRACSRDAARLLGVRSLRGFSPGERVAWQRWSPLVLLLDDVERWPAADRRALVGVIRAKGGRREAEYIRRFDRHRRLRARIHALAEGD